MKTLLVMGLLAVSFNTFATVGGQFMGLKKAAVGKFLQDANDPSSVLGKRIDQINIDTTDGRNQDGSINTPVTVKDLQVSVLSAEQIYNIWHYASKSEDGKTCTAEGDSASFLILLNSWVGVHQASEFQSYPFIVDVSESYSAVRKDGGVIEYCEDVFADTEDVFVVSEPVYSVEKIKEMSLPQNQ